MDSASIDRGRALQGEGRVEIEIKADPTVSYASYQNNVPLIRSLNIVNSADEPLRDIEVTVRCEPPFAEPMQLRFERLAPGEMRRLEALDLKFEHRYLAELTEAERGRILVDIRAGGGEIAHFDHPIEVLAYDQWAGSRGLPELLAAFSLPNDPAVDRLLFDAAELLARSGTGRMLNGYQSRNREDVWGQISSVYGAVAAANLHYSVPPASFGMEGQKIRTPDRVLSGGVATCLDLVMLITSCLEQAGLNPLVLIKKGHAWAGCWLINTTLPTAVFDDPQAVRKRVASGELLVFETTLLAQRPVAPLRSACETGLSHLQDEAEFLFALDVKRARIEQIRPLPTRTQALAGEVPRPNTADLPTVEPAPPLPPLEGETILLDEEERPETPEGRLARWKSKLLDLTLRNRLINFKPTRTTLPLRIPDPAHVEDALSEGQEWKFRALPPIMQGDDPRVAAVAARRTGTDPVEALAREAMQLKELLAPVEARTLDSRLYEIYSTARLGLEEGGANTLFLALGFLRWAEDERAERTHLAPILLVPVTLTRQSVRTGYAISRHDDETIVNPTLLELLRQNFQITLKGLDPLPADGGGVDVNKIWQIFRLAVKEIPRWEVVEDVYLGIFSFTKFLMWKDLQDRAEELKKNPVVRHLIERPHEPFGTPEDLSQRTDLDERHPPGSLLTPLIADSSQLNAVSRAAAGRDFALEGPPGTGKSQTITNLIAHFLGQGKTVLFVAEKMAALDVVHRRLNAIRLGPFCLELHSAKARKTEVLAQLRAAIEVSSRFSEEGWEREAERLGRLRAQLNEFARLLHQRHRNGLTVRRAMDVAIQYRQWPAAPMPWPDPDVHDERTLDQIRDLAKSIGAVIGELGTLAHHPLALVHRTDWTNAWEESLLKHAAALDTAAARLQTVAEGLAPVFGLSLSTPSSALLDAIDGVVDPLLQAAGVPPGYAAQCFDARVRTGMQMLQRHGEKRRALWAQLSPVFKPDVALADGASLAQAWALASITWWPKRWFAQRAVSGRLLPYTVDGKRPLSEAMPQLLDALRGLNTEDRALKALEAQAMEWLGAEYKGLDTDWSAVGRYAQWSTQLEEAIGRVTACVEAGASAQVKERLRSVIAERSAALLPEGPLAERLTAFRDAYRAFRAHLETVSALAGTTPLLGGEPRAAGLPSCVRSVAAGWSSARRSLRLWCRWRQLREQAINSGLEAVVARLEAGNIPARDIEAYVEYSYQVWWLKAVIDREPVLRNFSSGEHERRIHEFRLADERFEKLTEKYLAAVLASKVPQQRTGQKPDPEMGTLLKELAKQRAHLPVRKLVQRIPNLLRRLKPCLLMSPLSVAQYLDASQSGFDIVIFDEASQIPVWDAVGAIARGRQVVVVGDPKQLPPTNFFNRADEMGEEVADDSENAPVRDLESILDECLGMGLPTLRLEWHYRSRHESLIAFSNHRYYDSRLITFPSPVTRDMAVKLVAVPGIYDRGGSRTNRAEAEAIVKTIVEHFSNEERRRMTLGVVTFNQPQQRLIEMLLDEELRRAPELEMRIDEHGPERLFIKNLENVQGDERDLILFSITYGKDAAGRMAMNFGPLNREGGQRRLNVAITRARMGVTIFSSILGEDIDLSRIRASGVADLKTYLEYAAKGPQAIVQQAVPTGLESESPLEADVMRALRDRGWIVHPQVGCSGYRIDLAVVDPRQPGRYILGIECDGATYHALPTARDRDRLRQHILEGLGWSLHRIWSTDWWTDPERELDKLETALRKASAGRGLSDSIS